MLKQIPALVLWLVVIMGSSGMCTKGQNLISKAADYAQSLVETGECIRELQPEAAPNRREYSICLLIGLIGLTIPMIILIIAAPSRRDRKEN